jgi:DNA polymerase
MSDDLRRQVQARLTAYESAGIEWLPRVAAPAISVSPAETESLAPAPLAHVDSDSLAQRRHELNVLAERVSKCTRCPELAATRSQTVFGVGPVGAEILFLGEAPGFEEDRKGEPFVGPAGQLLNKIIAACGLRREDIYICNILRCRPPGNRQPKPEEAEHCREYLEKTIELVGPKLICCWGGVAAQNLLQATTGITKMRGNFYTYRDIPVLCTFHPSFLLRSPEKKKEVWEDMQVMMKKLGKTIPTTNRS